MAELIGASLTALLKERGMSQKELAEAAGLTPALFFDATSLPPFIAHSPRAVCVAPLIPANQIWASIWCVGAIDDDSLGQLTVICWDE